MLFRSVSQSRYDIAARYGGDEFTLILPECDENGAMTVANRISKRIEREKLIAPDGTKVGITISIGICVYPQHTMSQKDMFVIADSTNVILSILKPLVLNVSNNFSVI